MEPVRQLEGGRANPKRRPVQRSAGRVSPSGVISPAFGVINASAPGAHGCPGSAARFLKGDGDVAVVCRLMPDRTRRTKVPFCLAMWAGQYSNRPGNITVPRPDLTGREATRI